MIENFKISSKEIEKINLTNKSDKNFRLENLKSFNLKGFPTKQDEDWKFSDIRQIFSENFKKIQVNSVSPKKNSLKKINDFDHNHILLVNGSLIESDFKFEKKNKIKITNYKEENFLREKSDNPLICLNNALSNEGFSIN